MPYHYVTFERFQPVSLPKRVAALTEHRVIIDISNHPASQGKVTPDNLESSETSILSCDPLFQPPKTPNIRIPFYCFHLLVL